MGLIATKTAQSSVHSLLRRPVGPALGVELVNKKERIKMRISFYFSALPIGRLVGLAMSSLFVIGSLPLQARAQHASGGGTYFVAPGMLSEFQFNQAYVQCKVGHGVMPDGTVMQMFMASTSVDSVTIDSAAKTVTITGSMVSIVKLRFTDGTTATLNETVPYTAFAKDSSTAGGGGDFFSVTVVYADTPGLDQFDLFGSPATFAGTLTSGNVVIK